MEIRGDIRPEQISWLYEHGFDYRFVGDEVAGYQTVKVWVEDVGLRTLLRLVLTYRAERLSRHPELAKNTK